MAPLSIRGREQDRHGLDSLEGAPAGPPPAGDEAAAPRRSRGRPALMTRSEVLAEIRSLARRGDGLFRVHRARPDLYARARRFFGAWSEAVRRAGLDYESVVRDARSRSREPLRKRRGISPGR